MWIRLVSLFIQSPLNYRQFILDLFNSMTNTDFQLKLLIKQNTQMALKLQLYRRDNQQLNRKNHALNTSVQNLSEVFACLSAAWRTITDNEEALYTLMKKKSDNSSKALVNKYINHFKAFDEIIANLGQKINNEGHSEAATLDAKQRLTSFVNNYNLFFMEFIQTYFKFNEEYLSFLNQKLEANNMQTFTKNITNKELENRQKIKEFQAIITHLKDNIKIYEANNQHKLIDGLLLHKNKQIEVLKDQNLKQARKIAFMTDYNVQNVNRIIQEDLFECFCGGVKVHYFSKLWQQNLKKETKDASKVKEQKICEESDEFNNEKMQKYNEMELQNRLLLQRNVQALSKFQKLKTQNKLADELILQSPIYLHLRSQFSELLDYTNDLILKLNKHYEFMNEIQKVRLQQIQELKRKYERPVIVPAKNTQEDLFQNKFLYKFKAQIQDFFKQIKHYFITTSQKSKQKQQNLVKMKQSLKIVKRQNDEMNKKLNDHQQKMIKNIQNMEYRHSKYNELQEKVNDLLKKENKSQEGQRIVKLWQQFIDYVKNRDKKIKAMEDQIRKKDKEINQKNKMEEFLKNVLAETELTYVQGKEKFDKFSAFQNNLQKDILFLSEENYKIKLELEQQKANLQQKLKTQLQSKNRMQERIKIISKIQQQIKITKEKQLQLVTHFNEYMVGEKEKSNQIKLQMVEMERERQNLFAIVAEKDRNIQKSIEEREKKNLEVIKLRLFLKSIEQKTEYEAIKMEMQVYKSKIMCRCGADRQRSVILKTCPHIFCKKCIQDSTANRNRKCPICSVKFTKTDIHEISWS